MKRPPAILVLKGGLLAMWFGLLLFGTLFFHARHVELLALPRVLRAWLIGVGVHGPLIVLGVFLVSSVIPLPTSALTVAAGAVYGRVWGSLLVWIGLNLSASASFFLGRKFGRHLIMDVEHRALRLKTYDDLLAEEGFVTVLVLRLLYVPFEILSLVCGLSRMSFWEFLAATALGTIPSIVALVALGNAFHHPGTWAFFMGMLFVTLLLIAILYRFPRVRRRFLCRKRRGSSA